MDTSESDQVAKRCFDLKLDLYDKLNVLNNKSSLMLVLWNKYQIFLYENMNIEGEPIKFVPEFVTHDVILSEHFLLCLDKTGNVHVHSLKFKNPRQKRLKGAFQPREQGIAVFVAHTNEHSFSLKVENERAYLCLHKIAIDFQLKSKILLKTDFPIPPLHKLQEKCILKTYAVTESDHEYVKEIFKINNVENDTALIIASFNCTDIYSCLFDQRTSEETSLVKLYSCPLEIRDIEVRKMESLNILIGLKSGTVICLSFDDGQRKPLIIHLNISILKFLSYGDTLIYTNGSTMWKSEKTFLKKEMRLTQFIVKQVKDLIMFDDQILCVTYSNLVYLFTLEDETMYVKSLGEYEYYAAEKLLESSTQHDKITTELLRNLELAEKIRVESNYIATIALANRRDITNEVIKYKVLVCESFEEAINEETELRLTNEMHEYFEPETVLLLTKVTFSEQHKLNDIFVSLMEDLKLHLTISSGHKLVKTVSIEIKEVPKDIKILTPVKENDSSNVTVKIKLVPGLPGALDRNQKTWIVLSEEEVVLNSEHFIRSKSANRKTICLKNSSSKLEDLIFATADLLHGQLFSFTDISDIETSSILWSFYIKLPRDFVKLLSNEESYLKCFNKAKTAFLLKTFSSQDFHRAKSQINLQIGNESASLNVIDDDFAGLLLMITSSNIKTAQQLRSFFSEVLYGEYKNHEPATVFIPQSQYAIIEVIYFPTYYIGYLCVGFGHFL